MKRPRQNQGAAALKIDLRERAQARLQSENQSGPAPAFENPQRLLHELQVYQVELEMQNEQLEAARAWIEAALATYTELFDFAPIPYLTLDRAGLILESNLAAARLFGTERMQLLDRRLGTFVAMDDRGSLAACLNTVFATQSESRCDLSLATDDGKHGAVEIRATLSNDGKTCRAVIIDKKEHYASERRLARLGDAFLLAAEGMFITDRDGTIIDVNHAFSALTGYAPEQVVGKHEDMLRCARLWPGQDESIRQELLRNGSWSGATWHSHRNGETYRALEQISALVDGGGVQYYVSRFSRQLEEVAAATPLH